MLKSITQNSHPICVDLDGTLLATDILWESMLILAKKRPLSLLKSIIWLFKGKAYFKRQIANLVKLDLDMLPYRTEVLLFLKQEKKHGRKLFLVTATDQKVAESIAEELGVFSGVLGSDGNVNLSGKYKLQAIQDQFNGEKFDYIGDSRHDIPLWKAAHRAFLVSPSKHVISKIRQLKLEHELLVPSKGKLKDLIKTFRIHQWVKNILIFIPLLVSHKIIEIELVIKGFFAFLAFGFCASGIYIINDLFDISSDRYHPQKKHRTFAAGKLSIKSGILFSPILINVSFLISYLFLPYEFIYLLVLYVLTTSAYTIYFKQVIIIDVLMLSLLYTLRVLSGGVAVHISISPWLLAFSMFLFFNLAFVKRYSELKMIILNKQTRLKGRNYKSDDLELIKSAGISSGYLSVLVLVLYINSQEVTKLYHHPELLWSMAPFLLYWITRIWFLANRGELLDDPIIFAIKDLKSYGVATILMIIMILASIL